MRGLAILCALFLLPILTPRSGSAQYSIRGGWNLASASAEVDGQKSATGDHSGWHVGAVGNKGGPVSLNVGAFYSRRGFSVDQDGSDQSVRLDYIEVPLLVQLNAADLRGYVGPNFSFEVGCKAATGLSIDEQLFACNETDSTEFGWKAGAGLQILSLTLDVAYIWATTDIAGPESLSVKNRVLQLSGGFNLP